MNVDPVEDSMEADDGTPTESVVPVRLVAAEGVCPDEDAVNRTTPEVGAGVSWVPDELEVAASSSSMHSSTVKEISMEPKIEKDVAYEERQ